MKFDPTVIEATAAVRTCPACGSRHYDVKTAREGDGMRCVSINCTGCGLDILAVWKREKRRK